MKHKSGTVAKWLRRPRDIESTIQAWLEYNDALHHETCPDRLTVEVYRSQDVPVNTSGGEDVQIFCPDCGLGREIDMNLFWKRRGVLYKTLFV